MKKLEFLGKLEYELKKLKKEECPKYLDYYDEIVLDIIDRLSRWSYQHFIAGKN